MEALQNLYDEGIEREAHRVECSKCLRKNGGDTKGPAPTCSSRLRPVVPDETVAETDFCGKMI